MFYIYECIYGNISLTLAKECAITTILLLFKLDQSEMYSPTATNTPKTEITNCFIHRIQLKTVKSLKVIWCLGCLSPLSAQMIILAS